MGRWFFYWICDDEDVGSEPNPQPESSGSALSPSTTWLLPEVVLSYGRLNEYYCFNICLSLHDTFVRINCLELDGRLAWWRAALTIFTSYVNWNYYKLHTRCFFLTSVTIAVGWLCREGTQWGVRRCIIRLAVPRTRESYLPALHLSDPRYCSPVPTRAALLPTPPKSQSKPKWVTCQPHQSLFFIIGKYWAEPSFRKRWWHWW